MAAESAAEPGSGSAHTGTGGAPAGSHAARGRGNGPVVVRFGHEELVVRQRYAVASIINDILIAVWFIIGSVLFFSSDTATAGTWCFLLGSVELLVRPILRLTRQVHLQRLRTTHSPPPESELDF